MRAIGRENPSLHGECVKRATTVIFLRRDSGYHHQDENITLYVEPLHQPCSSWYPFVFRVVCVVQSGWVYRLHAVFASFQLLVL